MGLENLILKSRIFFYSFFSVLPIALLQIEPNIESIKNYLSEFFLVGVVHGCLIKKKILEA
jgi:hypothetical protein